MPIMRRRPLARAAMVGGGAYVAGKHAARNQQHEADQDAQLAGMQEQQYAPPPQQYAPPPQQYAPPQQQYAPPPAAPAPEAPPAAELDPIVALTKLKDLLDAGVLTQDEFDAQKRRVLGS